jgi:hypothetical protein
MTCFAANAEMIGVLQGRRQNGLLDDADELFEGNLALALHEAQHAQVDVHVWAFRY